MTIHRSIAGTTALVTGAGGFIGRYVITALEEAGVHVRAVLSPPSIPGALRTFCTSSKVKADCCDTEMLQDLATGADLLVHLAGLPSVAASFDNPAEYVRVHVQGTTCALEACRRTRVRRIIYISSAEVYGQPETDRVSEDHPLRARSPYGAAKIGAEAMVASYAASFGQDAIILRPFSIYGPGASPSSLLNRIIQQAVSGRPVVIHDLKPVRDYCFVEDLARAVLSACTFDAEAGLRTFNIGTMRGSSVAQIGEMLINALGASVPLFEDKHLRRPGSSEIYHLVSDNTKAGSILGWSPQVTLENGIRITAEAYK